MPAGDGSAAQNAIRRLLLDAIGSRVGDGGLQALHIRLSETRLLTSLAFAGHLRVSVYTVPITPLGTGDPAGSPIIGLDGHSARPPFYESSIGSRNDRDLGYFTAGAILPGHPSAQSP